MKIMLTSILLAFVLLSPVVFAQQKGSADLKFFAALDQGFTNSFGSAVSGGEVGIIKPVSENIELSLTAGVNHYFGASYTKRIITINTVTEKNSPGLPNIFPVKGGFRTFAGKLFYAGFEAGAGFAKTAAGSGVTETFVLSGPNKITTFQFPARNVVSFLYVPSIGFRLKNGIDAGIRYEGYSDREISKQYGFRLGYFFGKQKSY